MFSTQKRCLIGILIRGYQNFYYLSPKNWISGPKTAKFGPILAFSANYGHFWSKKLLEIDQFEVTMFLRGKSDLSFFLSLHNDVILTKNTSPWSTGDLSVKNSKYFQIIKTGPTRRSPRNQEWLTPWCQAQVFPNLSRSLRVRMELSQYLRWDHLIIASYPVCENNDNQVLIL